MGDTPAEREAASRLAIRPVLTMAVVGSDRRVDDLVGAIAGRLGATVTHAHQGDDHFTDAPGTVRCLAVGLEVADDRSLVTALRPGMTLLVVGPHCSGIAMLDGPIVVAFDGSSRAASIFPTARAWGRALDVPIVLTHMWTPFDAVGRGSAIFGAVREALAVLGPSARYEPMRTSYPAGGIRETAHECDAALVAMSPVGADAQPGAVLGHVAARVVRECSCPVLLHQASNTDAS